MQVLWFPMSNRRAPSARARSFAIVARLRAAGVRVHLCGYPTWPRWPNRAAKFAHAALHLWASDVAVFQKTAHWTTWGLLRLAQSLGKPVVFDIDDAVHLWREGAWAKRFLRQADLVVAGSHALLELAHRLRARKTVWIPSGVEPQAYAAHRVRPRAEPLIVGWIGTAANAHVLELVREPLAALARERRVVLRVVTDPRTLSLRAPDGVELEVVPWRLEEAAARIAGFDVGIMPLRDDEAARCKCAFKAIECMASGVPVVVSDVGENRYVIQHGSNGLIAASAAEWLVALRRLAEDAALRERLGRCGRDTVTSHYTTEVAARGWLTALAALVSPRDALAAVQFRGGE